MATVVHPTVDEQSPDFHNGMELSQLDSLEPIPYTALYRSSEAQRPALKDLLSRTDERQWGSVLDQRIVAEEEEEEEEEETRTLQGASRVKLGTFKGVTSRCLLNIWGVIMFLRLPWVVGHAGIGFSMVIILLANVVTTITTLSLSAISTNGEVRSGGAYFLISRSLGPEWGGSIGIIFFIANAVAVALYVVGFAETVVDIESNLLTNSDVNDVRFYGAVVVVALVVIALIGVGWEAKFQQVLLGVLLVAMGSFVIGSFAMSKDRDSGFLGYSSGVISDNWGPEWGNESFSSIFAIFFPAVTGIMAGANISGELKDPQKSIPRGTLTAVAVSGSSYLILAVMCGAIFARRADDDPDQGLLENFTILTEASLWTPLIFIGIFSATFSSALASFVGAPRVLQAVCSDGIFPAIEFLGRGVGPNNEPRNAYILTFVVALGSVAIGELNAIAPLITIFFLLSYTLINYACFSASLSHSPGWRPSFRYYGKFVSLAGAALCVAVMFLINWIMSLVSLGICAALYKYVEWSSPEVNWGSAGQARIYFIARDSLLKLEGVKKHVKTFRPQFLAMTGPPEDRPALVKFVTFFGHGKGVAVCGQVLYGAFREVARVSMEARASAYLVEKRHKAFMDVVAASTLRSGFQSLLQVAGLGKLRPNTVILGYKTNWLTADDTEDYVNMIRDALEYGCGIMVVRGADILCSPIKPKGTIDVYWLVDDGGLTILLPYLLRRHKRFSECTLRFIQLTGRKDGVEVEHLRMSRMLRRFRIKCEVISIQARLTDTPMEETFARYRDIGLEGNPNERANRFLRLSEVMTQYSSEAVLIFCSLVVPVSTDEGRTFMSFLEVASTGLPPVIFMRGNNESVLTFDS